MSGSKWRYSPEKCDGDFCPGDCDKCPKCWEDVEDEESAEEMKDAAKVERTVFLDKCMIQRIVGWILIDLFHDSNKEIRKTISRIAQTFDGTMQAELKLMIHLHRSVDAYYELYQKMEAEQCAEDEGNDDGNDTARSESAL